MNTAARELYDQALRLSDSERAELAAWLIESLDADADRDAEAAWEAEIRRRVESIDRGEVELIPWDAVLREMRQRRNV